MIQEITIKNYKSCENLSLQLKEPITALIGKNAAGKTNTLKAIDFASVCCSRPFDPKTNPAICDGGFGATFRFKIKEADCIYQFRFYGKNESYIKDSLKIAIEGTPVEVFRKHSKTDLRVYRKKNSLRIPTDYSGLAFLREILFSDDKPDFAKRISEYNYYIFEILIQLFTVKYYSAFNKINLDLIVFKEEFTKWVNDKKPLVKEDLDTFRFLDFYYNKNEAYEEFKSILISLGLIQDIECSEMEVKGKLGTKKFDVVLIEFKVNNRLSGFSDLSDGTQNLISVLFRFFSGPNSLFLIEELENSVHWGLLKGVLSILSEYTDRKKIIITTHSEQILNHLDPNQIIYIYNDAGKTKRKYIRGKALSRVKAYLNDIGPFGEYLTSGSLESDLDE